LDATASVASRVVQVYGQLGKGQHPASLNFCDCFAYEAAKTNTCPLLYVGRDFSQTDIVSALRN
jgi:ribonuclease VapC